MNLPSTKPYLLRAIYEWCCDHGFTPHIAVVVDARTRVPPEFVRDGQIVLNIGPDATHRLQIGNDRITFQARFGGVARDLSVPVDNVAAIYARENGAGMGFEVDDGDAMDDGDDPATAPDSATHIPPAAATEAPVPDEPPPAGPPAGGRPRLQRVK